MKIAIRPFRTIPLRAPRFTLAAILVMTVVFGYFARSLRVDSSVEDLLPPHDPERVYYNGVRDAFGSDEATLIAVFSDNVFTPETLAKVNQLSSQLAAIKGVREVISLTTVKGVEVGDMGLHVGTLMQTLPTTPEEAAAFKERVLRDPLYVGHLVSKDGSATAILVLFDVLSEQEFLQRGIERQITRLVDAARGPEQFALTGLQTLKIMGAEEIRRDLRQYLPISVLVVAALLIWAFRSVRGVLLPLAAVLIGAVWTAGFMVLIGNGFNMGTLVLPPLLMATGIAYAIPLISRYNETLCPQRSTRDSVRAAVEALRLPLAIAAFATVLGFVALACNSVSAIHDLGMAAVFGIAAMYFVTLGLIPASLVLLPAPKAPERDRHRLLGLCIQRASSWAAEHRRGVLLAVGIACAIALCGAIRVRVQTDYLSFFNPSSAVRIDNSRIADKLGGTQPIYVVVDGDGPQSITRLETLAALRDLQDFMDQQPGVDSSLSLVDYISVAQKALNPDAKTPLPATPGELSQLLLFVTPEDVRPVATADYSRANILVRTRLSGSMDVGAFIRAVEDYGRTRLPPGTTVHVTGVVALLNRSADDLAHGHVAGLWQMLVVLLVLMSLLFLSVRAGLLSLVPIVVPITLLFGVMGWTGIHLNVSTCMIAVIAVGITVANTIHYLNTLNSEIHRTGNEAVALQNVARTVGEPIVFSTLALAAGFAVLCLSTFQPIQYFGLLAALTVLLTLAATLLVTPALVMTTRLITLWDLLYVKLGPQPQREIPLFEGLRPFQARMVVLMSQFASATPGTFLTRRGERKPELYILLSGQVAFHRREGEPVIRRLARGEVIGEMGLVRDQPRSGDNIVVEPTEYLVLDAAALDRIRRRYPRIAATVMLNLTRILSDRLENTTDQLTTLTGARAGRTAA